MVRTESSDNAILEVLIIATSIEDCTGSIEYFNAGKRQQQYTIPAVILSPRGYIYRANMGEGEVHLSPDMF
jgi:hypothetical protein